MALDYIANRSIDSGKTASYPFWRTNDKVVFFNQLAADVGKLTLEIITRIDSDLNCTHEDIPEV